MPHYVILNRHMCFLVWSGEASTADEAFSAYFFKNKMLIEPHGPDWVKMHEIFEILEVTAEQRAEVEQWHKNGGRHFEFPLHL